MLRGSLGSAGAGAIDGSAVGTVSTVTGAWAVLQAQTVNKHIAKLKRCMGKSFLQKQTAKPGRSMKESYQKYQNRQFLNSRADFTPGKATRYVHLGH
jgi:hypothetical protein